ncbi:MAG: prolipoprotein diacylglyceryl transferase [Chloroflexi bacterium]|nr:MAG: prolipoprotein diacylglyceryl transferase [Chloroflexota bacterium]
MMFLEIQVDLDPNLFAIGPFTLTWHGIFSVLGILATIRMSQWLAWRSDKIPSDKIYDAAFWAVVVGLLGARIHYVLENYKLFAGHWLDVLAVNKGGISQWGGIFGGLIGIWIWSRRNAISYWKLVDAVGPPALVGLAVGRIGDVINGEHHGTPTTLPWGVRYINPHTLGQPGSVVHPEVAYEMILSLALVALLLPFYGRLRARFPDGVTGLLFLSLYAVGRFYLSYFRADQIEFGLRQAQWASLLMVVLGIVFGAYLLSRPRPAVAAPVPVPAASAGRTRRRPAAPPPPPGDGSSAPAPRRSTRAAGGSTRTRRRPPPTASPPDP